jgi:hypothetical protein
VSFEIPQPEIPQLCFTYNEAQKASRDPKRRDNLRHYLEILGHQRNEIEARRDRLTSQLLADKTETSPAVVAELVYFNTWFARRGGW